MSSARMDRRRVVATAVRIGVAALLLALLPAAAGRAEDYPARPLKVVVGFPPGGGTDFVARLIGDQLSKGLGQPVIVENRPGAAGTIGAALVAKSDPDGYTLLVTPGGHSLFGAVFKSLSFDTVNSFSWISNVINVSFYVVVPAESNIRSMTDLVAAAKADPGKVTFGSAGPGSTHHLAGELLGHVTGVKFLHVPYRGDAPVITALLGRQVDFAFATPTQVIANVQAGKFRALAITAARRSSDLPEVPTVEEALGIKGFDIRTWFALAGPANMPPPIVERLNGEIRKAMASDQVRKGLASVGGEIEATSPEAMRERVATELAMWTKIVDEAQVPRQ